ncbi:MAG: Gfo/Idh/MocA family oxidoreductase [Clostridia bacterium]|nr:Gfo/Idh/MocA family oxidoreductase [Clostridia bacterium]
MEKLKVGMVGIGRGTAYGNIFANHPDTEVVALCDLNSDALAENGKAFGLSDRCLFEKYEDMLNSEVDIVVLGTPIPYHAQQTICAMEAGKHVLCEVTASDNIPDCIRMVDAVRKARTKFMLAENCNYMHFAMEWNKDIKAGKIGTPFYAEADYVHEIRTLVDGKWRANRAPLHYCSHSLGPLLMWMDDYIVRCTASGNQSRSFEKATDGNIDMQVALFETAKGATIKVLRSSVALRHPALCSYSIYGTKGALESSRSGYSGTGYRYFEDYDPENGMEIAVSFSDPNAPKSAQAGGHGTSEFYLVQDFLRSIREDSTPPVDIVRGMDMTVPGLVAHEAAKRGGVWLDVPRVTD